eukprot:TRINITY_DN3519_c0_g2_i1.p2 TRINITY_DN3519_c0_g2~~TRINITY_DN3519_c0_g2_i1.p2  ORF type:complete len:112 (+),score=11.03 TRINITY_DN3519_c0_g2_i1:260-595(+)
MMASSTAVFMEPVFPSDTIGIILEYLKFVDTCRLSLCNRFLVKQCLSLTSSVHHTGLEKSVIDVLKYSTGLRALELRPLGFFAKARCQEYFHHTITSLQHMGLNERLTRCS